MIICSNAPQHEETEAQRSDDMLKLEQLVFEFKMLLPHLEMYYNTESHMQPAL